MEKLIELTALAEIGRGCARITDDGVSIEISGIREGMKAWLIGGDAVAIGNIVDGRLVKKIDTRKHNGILITQSGRQMLIGRYAEEKALEKNEEAAEENYAEKETQQLPAKEIEKVPFEVDGFTWRKFTEKSFDGISRQLRFILSNRNVYDNYKKHQHYWVVDAESSGALALKCEEAENDPLEFLGQKKIRKNGYVIVCVDKETNKLYIPD